MIKFNRRSQMG